MVLKFKDEHYSDLNLHMFGHFVLVGLLYFFGFVTYLLKYMYRFTTWKKHFIVWKTKTILIAAITINSHHEQLGDYIQSYFAHLLSG